MCLNVGILSILKQNNVNLQAFIVNSLDDVLPNFRQCAKYLQDFYLTFCTLLKIFHNIKYQKLRKRKWDSTKNNVFNPK